MPRPRKSTKKSYELQCPRCRKVGFSNESDLLNHMNQPWAACALLAHSPIADSPSHSDHPSYAEDNTGFPIADIEEWAPSSHFDRAQDPVSNADSSEPHIDFFPAAGDTYGAGSTFMDKFNADEYAARREKSIYWPFASKSEWSFASWLLRSGLSMQAIDRFLSLEMVFKLLVCLSLPADATTPDSNSKTFFSVCERPTRSC